MLTRVLAVTLSLTLAAPTVTIAQAPPNCSNIADQFDRETRAFTAEADRQNLDFVKELALDKITGALKQRLSEAVSGTMAGDIATHLSENWEAANTARDRLTRAREYFDEWLACFNAPLGTCDRAALNKRYRDEFKAYMDSLLDDAGQSEARQRVDRARGLLHNYLDRTMNISKGTMQAMAACTAPMTRQARPQLTEAQTPSAAAPQETEVAEPPSKPVENPGGGMSGTTILAGVALAGAGGYYLLDKSKSCTEPTTNFFSVCSSQGGSSSACSTAREAQRAYCTCLGMGFSTSGGCTQ